MSNYTTLYKCGKRTCNFLESFLILFSTSFLPIADVFNTKIFPSALVGCDMIMVNLALRVSLTI